jgi:hypothetical protein
MLDAGHGAQQCRTRILRTRDRALGVSTQAAGELRELADARTWFERAARAEKHRQIAETYLQIIDAHTASAPA